MAEQGNGAEALELHQSHFECSWCAHWIKGANPKLGRCTRVGQEGSLMSLYGKGAVPDDIALITEEDFSCVEYKERG